jgi:hypothetical protein
MYAIWNIHILNNMFEKFDELWSMFAISFGRLNEDNQSEIPKQ